MTLGVGTLDLAVGDGGSSAEFLSLLKEAVLGPDLIQNPHLFDPETLAILGSKIWHVRDSDGGDVGFVEKDFQSHGLTQGIKMYRAHSS